MNNPNEAILLTEVGTPIGEVVVAANSSVRPMLTNEEIAESSREEQMRAVAAELTGDPDADRVIAEWFPGYTDGDKRKQAMALFIAEGRPIEDIARAMSVPDRTVAQWMYVGQWERIVKQELVAKQAASSVELARIRAEKRAKVAKRQLEAAEAVRDAALEQLKTGDASVKSAAEAMKSAADVEARILGVSESGALDDTTGAEKRDQQANGKQPLVMVFNGGLPPVRKST